MFLIVSGINFSFSINDFIKLLLSKIILFFLASIFEFSSINNIIFINII